MSKLTVIVIGHQKTGKSTISAIIANTLRDHGFRVVHTDESSAISGPPRYMLEPAVAALLEKKTEISVREVSA